MKDGCRAVGSWMMPTPRRTNIPIFRESHRALWQRAGVASSECARLCLMAARCVLDEPAGGILTFESPRPKSRPRYKQGD